MSTGKSEHLRFRYGICLNDSCQKCKSKEVQQIAARKDFVCAECQKQLRECPPPKTFMQKYGKYVISGGTIIAIAAVIALVKFLPSAEKDIPGPEPTEKVTKPQTPPAVEPASPAEPTKEPEVAKEPAEVKEPAKEPEEVNKPAKQEPAPKQKAAISVPFGKYSGPASGLDGEITVTRTYSLDLRNASGERLDLQPGDMITKTKFKNGELVSGYWKRGTQGRSFHR